MEEVADPVRLVLDTSVFTNPDSARAWGRSPAAALAAFVALAREAGDRCHCFMPPSVYEELLHFVGRAAVPPELELVVQLKAPNRYEVRVPGFLLYELIDDIRTRIDRGLRVAERAVREGTAENVDRTIHRLRARYREAVRSGLLDSREDVDLILLAREIDGALVSSDGGMVRWAERLGIRLIHPDRLRAVLEQLARAEVRQGAEGPGGSPQS